jgi:Nickel responsive protein SCO4226-like
MSGAACTAKLKAALRYRTGEQPKEHEVQRYLIERNIQGASELSHADLVEIARTSCKAVASLGVPYNWITSYVAGDKIYCLHEAEDAETIVEHARRGGFPADVVAVVANEFGPHTAAE